MTSPESTEPVQKRLPAWLPVAIIGSVIAIVVVIAVSGGGSSNDQSAAPAITVASFAPSDRTATTTTLAPVAGTPLDPGPVQPVVVTGETLPAKAEGADPAVGMVAPEVSGYDLAGNPIAFTNGKPRAVIVVAHWCPHCQAEVDDLTAWMADNPWPEGVEIETLSTWVTSQRSNFPPSKWFSDVAWPFAVMADDDAFTAADAYGLSGTPMWVFIDADGTVVDRTGGMSPEKLVEKLAALAA